MWPSRPRRCPTAATTHPTRRRPCGGSTRASAAHPQRQGHALCGCRFEGRRQGSGPPHSRYATAWPAMLDGQTPARRGRCSGPALRRTSPGLRRSMLRWRHCDLSPGGPPAPSHCLSCDEAAKSGALQCDTAAWALLRARAPLGWEGPSRRASTWRCTQLFLSPLRHVWRTRAAIVLHKVNFSLVATRSAHRTTSLPPIPHQLTQPPHSTTGRLLRLDRLFRTLLHTAARSRLRTHILWTTEPKHGITRRCNNDFEHHSSYDAA